MRAMIIAAGVIAVLWGGRRSFVEGFKSAPDNRRAAQGCPVMVLGVFVILAGALG